MERSHLDAVLSLDYDRSQILDFLDPIEDIIAAVRDSPAHAMIGIEDASGLIGFFVVYPDPRDRACWWLGWFAIDQPHQGRGYGRQALAHVIAMVGRIDGCRRIRLLVADDNLAARRLYAMAGFEDTGSTDEGWPIFEYEVEAALPGAEIRSPLGSARHALPGRRMRRRPRLRATIGRFAGSSIGPVRGPPWWTGDLARLCARPASAPARHASGRAR